MNERAYSFRLWGLIAFAAGAVLALVMVPLVARMAAVVAPASVFAWFASHQLATLGIFLWDVLIVFGLSIALPAAVLLLVLIRRAHGHGAIMGAYMGAGIFFSLYVTAPLLSGQAMLSPANLAWWQQGLIASLLLAFGLALGVARALPATIRPGARA